MSKACLRWSPVKGMPDTLSKMSPTLSLLVSQAGWRGKTFLILMRWVQGGAASGPPHMEKPRPKEFRWISTSKVFVRSEKFGRDKAGASLLSLLSLLPPLAG